MTNKPIMIVSSFDEVPAMLRADGVAAVIVRPTYKSRPTPFLAQVADLSGPLVQGNRTSLQAPWQHDFGINYTRVMRNSWRDPFAGEWFGNLLHAHELVQNMGEYNMAHIAWHSVDTDKAAFPLVPHIHTNSLRAYGIYSGRRLLAAVKSEDYGALEVRHNLPSSARDGALSEAQFLKKYRGQLAKVRPGDFVFVLGAQEAQAKGAPPIVMHSMPSKPDSRLAYGQIVCCREAQI
ncbi:MAG: hypothetical protein AB7G06_08410 [Bdellovibrionales bacterium]